jgi:hypothetical protein
MALKGCTFACELTRPGGCLSGPVKAIGSAETVWVELLQASLLVGAKDRRQPMVKVKSCAKGQLETRTRSIVSYKFLSDN